MNRRWLPTWAAIILAATGCSEGPHVVPVSGVVLHQGRPVPELFLNFEPEQGRPSWAVTDAEGRFQLQYTREQEGAVVGEHRVWVRTAPSDPAAEMRQIFQGESAANVAGILQKYGDERSSPLRIEIAQATDSLEIALD